MEIEVQSLTTCDITADNGLISLGFVDISGQPVTIQLSVEQAGAWIMTLPGLVDKALQTRYADATLRYTYPLASWKVEQSTDPNHCMMTLKTADGFGACFLIAREQWSQLREAFAVAPPPVVLRSN
jgi:hypothetical protein